MTHMSVTWTDAPIGTPLREKPPFRCIKNNSQPKTPILTSDLRSSICDLRGAPSQMYGSEIEGTSAGNLSKTWLRAGERVRICDFSMKIEADVRSDRRTASAARFTVLL
jgi:hypothetical protein